MTSYVPIVKNSAGGAILYMSLAPVTATGRQQTNPTLAAGDVKASLDGAALANLATLPVVTPAGSTVVKVTLSQAETNADNIVIVFADQTNPPEWCDLVVNVQTAAKQLNDLPTASENATGLLDLAAGVETNVTLRQFFRLASSVLFGKASGLAGTTAVYRDFNDTKNRISATVDADGNRSAFGTRDST
jgi:hypothetical protein